MKKTDLTREYLIDNGIRVEFDENNQPVIFQHREEELSKGRE